MSKSNYLENAILGLLFNATAIADLAENDTTSPATDLYVAFHTADPGEAGTQATSECNYTGYARVAVARTAGGWALTGNSISPGTDVNFPNPTDTTNLPQTVTHFSVGTGASGATVILYKGPVSPNIVIDGTGVTPQLLSGSTITED